MENPKGGAVVGVAWYSSEQWGRLRSLSSDADQLEETWEEWHDLAESKFREMRRLGMEVERVVVDVDRLARWCEREGRPIDGASRSAYAAEMLRLRHRP
jgi:hypothetical protein